MKFPTGKKSAHSIRPTLSLVMVLFLAATALCDDRIEPGLYLRTSYLFGNLDITSVWFGPGNKIAFNPKHGVDPYDWGGEGFKNQGTAGIYNLSGGNFMVEWINGKQEKISVEFENGKISAYDGGVLSKAEAFKPNTLLNATYGWVGTTANVSASHTLELRGDGTYMFDNVGGIHHVPKQSGRAETLERGTYLLSGNTLTLRATTGETFKHTVIRMNMAIDSRKTKLSDDHLILDSLNLTREK